MNVAEIKEGSLKDAFDALEEAFEKNNIDFYLIGAQARDQWYSKGNLVARRTNDVDFAVYVSDKKNYEAVRNYLKENFKFFDVRGNQFVLFSPAGLQVDILPFGVLEIDDAVNFKGEGLSSIKVNGFKEIGLNGTKMVETDTGHKFRVASLSSIVLMKLIAFDDRPDERHKDAQDVDNILKHFFELQADVIYANHGDIFQDPLFEKANLSLPEISAIVIGREIRKIIQENDTLLFRLKRILKGHLAAEERSSFIRMMVFGTNGNVAEKVKLLENILKGLLN